MLLMSVKKAIALSFILLANAILLAHAVMPHHHHDDGNKIEECPLKAVYVRFDNNKSLVDLSNDNSIQYPVLFLFPVNPVVEITKLESLPFRQKPYLLSYHTGYISQSIGLRAPPVKL